jgi:hypothetical protein
MLSVDGSFGRGFDSRRLHQSPYYQADMPFRIHCGPLAVDDAIAFRHEFRRAWGHYCIVTQRSALTIGYSYAVRALRTDVQLQEQQLQVSTKKIGDTVYALVIPV